MLNDLLACECGETPEISPPTLSKAMEGSDPRTNPGRFYSVLSCACGIEMHGPNFDHDGSMLADSWNARQKKIRAR